MNIAAPKDIAAPQAGSESNQTGLALPLQQALECLPVNLEEELIRYRRAVHGDTPVTSARLTFRRRRRGLDLIKVEAKSAVEAQSTALPGTPPLPPPNPKATASTTAHLATSGNSLAAYEPIPQDYLETTEALLEFDHEGAPSEPEETYTPTLAQRLSTPLGLGALLLLLISCGGLGYLATNPRAVQHLWQHPALQALRGQSTPEAGDPTDPSTDGGEVPFKGMGPDLSQREFVDLDLSNLSTLPSETTGRPIPAPSDEAAPTGDSTAQDEAETADQPASSSQAPAPASPVQPRTVVRPLITAQPTTPPRRSQAPQPPQAAAPATPATRPSAPAAAAPSPSAPTAPSPSTDPNYYVVTGYTGDQSLNEARQVVEDAYVRNFPQGARIQMGAFDQESSAQDLLNQLESQGIPAQLYKPE